LTLPGREANVRSVTAFRLPLVAALALLCAIPVRAQQQGTDKWEKDVAAFEAADRLKPPPKGEILFVGSSTIVNWDVALHFPDLRIISRGLWGSALIDTLRYVDRLVIPYEPRLVVVYAGENEVDWGGTSEEVGAQFERFARAVHAKLPQTRILFIGLKPTPQRWLVIDRIRITNALIRAICQRDDRLAFLDVDGVMMGWDERPRRELFQEDGLHLSPEGYRLWSTLVRPFLVTPAQTPTSLPPGPR
jgi:lysophospholipase L1-like esterase